MFSSEPANKQQDFFQKYTISPNDCLVDQDSLIWFFMLLDGKIKRGEWLNDFLLPDILDMFSMLENMVLFDSLVVIDQEQYIMENLQESATFNETPGIKDILIPIQRNDVRSICFTQLADTFKKDYESTLGRELPLDRAKQMALELLDYRQMSEDEKAKFQPAAHNMFIRLEEAIGHPNRFEIMRMSRHIHLTSYKRLGDLPNELWLKRLFDQTLANNTIASILNTNYSPSSLNLPSYNSILALSVSPSKRLYNALSGKLSKLIGDLSKLGYPLSISIPPIPAILLSRSNSPNDLLRETLALREDFAPFRKKMRDFSCVIQNPDGMILDKLLSQRREVLYEVEDAINTLAFTRSDERLMYELFTGDLDINNSSIPASFSMDGLSDYLFASHSYNLHSVKGRVEVLFNLEKKVREIKDYHKLLKRVFHFGVKNFEVPVFKEYTTKVTQAWSGQDRTWIKTEYEQFEEHEDKDDTSMIKILFLAANPTDTSRLRLDEEIRSIDQALRQTEFRDRFVLYQQWAVRVTDLQGHLLRYKPNIVHFSGHGSTSNEIILEDNNGNSHPVPPRALSQLFSVLKDDIKCILLNACFSENQAQELASNIDCVIGMSKAIGDKAAISFATAFYQALGYGRDVKTAFELGCLQIDLKNLNDQDVPKLIAEINHPEHVKFIV